MPSTVQKVYLNMAASNTKIQVQVGFSNIVGWNLYTNDNSNAYLKIFNAADVTDVTLGTTEPVLPLCIPGGGTAVLSNEDKFQVQCNKGIVIAVTSAGLISSSAAPSAVCMVMLLYNTNAAN